MFNREGAVRVWDVTERKTLMTVQGSWPALSPDGKLLASEAGKEVAGDKEAVTVWNVDTKRKRVRYPIESHVRSLAFSPDSKILGIGDDRGRVCLWDVAKSEVITEPGPNPDHPVESLLFSPDGSVLVYATRDGTIKLFAIEKRKELASLKGYMSPHQALAFSKDGKVLGYAEREGNGRELPRVKFWDIAAGKEAGEMLASGTVHFLHQLDDGKTWLTWVRPRDTLEVAEPGVTRRELVEAPRRLRPHGQDEHLWCVAVTPDRKKVLLSVGREVRIIDMPEFPAKGAQRKGSKPDK